MRDEEEEQETQADSIPFVITNELLDQYGNRFAVSLNEEEYPIVTVSI